MANNIENRVMVDNKVYMEIQPSTYIDPYLDSTMEVIFANSLSRYDDGEHRTMPDDLRYSIDSNGGGTVGTNIITQLQTRMDNIDGGPWYVDVYEGEIIIHNRKFKGQPIEAYEYNSGNGELLSATFKTVKMTRTVTQVITRTMYANRGYHVGGNYSNFGSVGQSPKGDPVVTKYIMNIGTGKEKVQASAVGVTKAYVQGKITFEQYDTIMNYIEEHHTTKTSVLKYDNGIYKLQLGTVHYKEGERIGSGKWSDGVEKAAYNKRNRELELNRKKQSTAQYGDYRRSQKNPKDYLYEMSPEKAERIYQKWVAPIKSLPDNEWSKIEAELMQLAKDKPQEFKKKLNEYLNKYFKGPNSTLTVPAELEESSTEWVKRKYSIYDLGFKKLTYLKNQGLLSKDQADSIEKQTSWYSKPNAIPTILKNIESRDQGFLNLYGHKDIKNNNRPVLQRAIWSNEGDGIIKERGENFIVFHEQVRRNTVYNAGIFFTKYFTRDYGDYNSGNISNVSGFNGYGGGGSMPIMPMVISTPTPQIKTSTIQKKQERDFKKASITCIGNPSLHNTSSIAIRNVGKKWSGSWYMHTVTHTLVPNQGYTCKAELSVNKEAYEAEVNWSNANTTLNFGSKNDRQPKPEINIPTTNYQDNVSGSNVQYVNGIPFSKGEQMYIHQQISLGNIKEAKEATADIISKRSRGIKSTGTYTKTTQSSLGAGKKGGDVTSIRYQYTTTPEQRKEAWSLAEEFIKNFQKDAQNNEK